VRSLEGIIAEYDAIKREIGSLRERVEKTTTTKSSGDNVNGQNRGEEGEEAFGGASAEVDDNDSRSIRTIVPHELKRVEEEDEEQMAKQEEEEQEEESGTAKTEDPKPMSLWMSHLSEDDNRRLNSPKPPLVIDELSQSLTTLSNQLESAVELSSSLPAQHAAAQNTI